MGLFRNFAAMLKGEKLCDRAHLEGYRRIGAEVYNLHQEAERTAPSAKAKAYLAATEAVYTIAHNLLLDAQTDEGELVPVPLLTHHQAEKMYELVPKLATAVRQELAFEGGAALPLPIRVTEPLSSELDCPPRHLIALKRAVQGLHDMAQVRVENARDAEDKERFREAILIFEEARTMKEAGDAIVGSITGPGMKSKDVHEDGEKYYWKAVERYVLVVQGLELPEAIEGELDRLRGTSRRASPGSARRAANGTAVAPRTLYGDDPWRLTSRIARTEIRNDGETRVAERELIEFWEGRARDPQGEAYEADVAQLLSEGAIVEEAYWACCPFPSVYRVVRGPVTVLGREIPRGYMFTMEYNRDPAYNRFLARPSFRRADREYCEPGEVGRHGHW